MFSAGTALFIGDLGAEWWRFTVEFLGLLLIFGMGVLFVQRALWRWKKRTGKGMLGFCPSAAALGNALQVIQVIAQPHVKYVIEEKLEEPSDADDESGRLDPTAHLMRQARRIRNGEELEYLTTLLP